MVTGKQLLSKNLKQKNNMWKDLTMKERSDLMSLFLKHGISSLSDMKNIYDDGGYRETINKPAVVSRELSREEWNNLYRNNKISLNEIPYKYRNWIEGENSNFKKQITETMNKAGHTTAKVGAGIAAVLGGVSAIPNLPHIFNVIANPLAANTAAGTVASTAFNSYGLTLGLQNIYNTTKKAINNPNSVSIPEYITLGIDTLPFISGIKNLSNGVKPFINKTFNTIHSKKPQLHELEDGVYSTGISDMQYRIVGKSALEDANRTGFIRSRTGLHHDTQEYLRNNYGNVLNEITNWESMSADEILNILENKKVLKNSLLEEKLNIRPSTNHGNTVGYFHERTYPSYMVGKDDIVITTPGTSDRFTPGHGGRKYNNIKFGESPSATLLTDLDGRQRNAFINTNGSTYWKFNKRKNIWEEFKFKSPKKTQKFLDRLPIRLNIDESGYYYRNLLNGNGAEEVLNTKIIRGNPESPFKMSYFNKDYVPVPHNGDIVIKMPEVNRNWDFKWLGLTPHQTASELHNRKISELVEFGKSGNTTQFTPLVEGSLNNVPLTTGSSVWERKSFLGIPYYLKKYKNGGYLYFNKFY